MSSTEGGAEALVGRITGLLYPFVIVVGLYIIFNGHDTPGGGFQGGAILATLFIGRLIVSPINDINAHLLHDIEQAMFLLILLIPVVFLFFQLHLIYPWLNEPFLVAMNLLIGLKVALGLTIVVFRFGFDEEAL
ncbi:MAG: MnhB domain-containing protein [Alkalispirochaetaceae bacterium]